MSLFGYVKSIFSQQNTRLNPYPDHSELPPELTMSEFIKELHDGNIKYRLKSDTNETAKDKFNLRGFTFNFDKDDSSTDEVLTFNGNLFNGADLNYCEFNKCTFIGVYFIDCDLNKTKFNNCTFIQSVFLISNILGSIFNACVFEEQIIERCNMNNSNFIGTSFGRMNTFLITDTSFRKTSWEKCFIQNGEIIDSSVFSGSTFESCNFNRVVINGCILNYVTFYNTNVYLCEFIKNNMETVNFIDKSDKSDKSDERPEISDCNFKELKMKNLILFYVLIKRCYFENIELPNSTFTGTDIFFSVFKSCNLTGLELNTPINLLRCIFSSANFSNIKILKESDDDTIDVSQSTFEHAIFTNVNPAEIFSNYDPYFTESQFHELFDQEKIEVNYQEQPDLSHLSPLSPLEIKEESQLNHIVQLLTPNIIHDKLPISEMVEHKWYGISELGNTTLEEWRIISENELDEMPTIGYVFKCISVPEQKEGESVVYIANPPCMDVHELSRQLNIPKIFEMFEDIHGNKSDDYNIEEISVMFAKLLYNLLSIHNADEGNDSWTNVFNDIKKRETMINHAVFHSQEGIMFHPFFVESPNKLLDLILFIEKLPLQIQVAWAQNYMNEFITGYDQTLEDFDPEKRGDMGFIATCINGNFEKILFSIRTAIVQFYKTERPVEETEEEKRQTLINWFTVSLFNTYYESLGEEGASIEGYKTFIAKSNLSDEQKRIFLSMFDDATILYKLKIKIGQAAGKGRNRNKKKTIKKAKNKMKKRTIKKAKNNKKPNKKPNKKLNNKTVKRVKKNKKIYQKHK